MGMVTSPAPLLSDSQTSADRSTGDDVGSRVTSDMPHLLKFA